MGKVAYYPAALERGRVGALQLGGEPWWLLGGVVLGLAAGWLVWSSGAAAYRAGLR